MFILVFYLKKGVGVRIAKKKKLGTWHNFSSYFFYCPLILSYARANLVLHRVRPFPLLIGSSTFSLLMSGIHIFALWYFSKIPFLSRV